MNRVSETVMNFKVEVEGGILNVVVKVRFSSVSSTLVLCPEKVLQM